MEEILIVDGYNIIGAAEEGLPFARDRLEDARDWLIDKLADYQGYTGTKVYVVFDAHLVPGVGKVYKERKIEVIYTREKETADECIEKLVRRLKRVQRQIYVATSDYTEQRVIFAEGALRKSARELLMELNNVEVKIRQDVQEKYQQKPKSKFPLTKEMAEIFEKWRRES
ncbi:putative RNA-binding protein with PIN domain [Caldalkalibacillus uzonensis]|uniref:RNA-binding protein with PIN domain n=1 Tax=Caldalkalibacillus uzonensis TaxID=353224 RepID=A0ABU0CVL2_9BACI|nr:putative RNA-binding protein with PIN domain [Caldalkalibacillus uzonensis]